MKFTSRILFALLIILIAGVFLSNVVLKREYDKVDKTDVYWNYEKVLQQPFKYLKITGGNITKITFEQSPKYSVRILQEWKRYHEGKIKAHVINDTLYINFDFVPANEYEKYWMKGTTSVRIFSPQLLFVDGNNTNFEMDKLKQKTISVKLTGKSSFEVESMYSEMDSINISQSDSSAVVFEMSPDYRKKDKETNAPVRNITHTEDGGTIIFTEASHQNDFNESMSINSVTANIKGYSILDVGHAQIQKLQLQVQDSSAIVLSGDALKKINKQF